MPSREPTPTPPPGRGELHVCTTGWAPPRKGAGMGQPLGLLGIPGRPLTACPLPPPGLGSPTCEVSMLLAHRPSGCGGLRELGGMSLRLGATPRAGRMFV